MSKTNNFFSNSLRRYKFWKIMLLADYILIILLLALALLLTLLLRNDAHKQWVDIYVNDKIVETIALEKDAVVDLEGLGSVEIKAGKVRIIDSTCEHHLCEKQGWSDNLPIICVPHKIALVIRKEKPDLLITK